VNSKIYREGDSEDKGVSIRVQYKEKRIGRKHRSIRERKRVGNKGQL
jgi:hypothetical protein